jgi:hypothetical protein
MKTRPIYECRCDERLKTKAEESTRLTYTNCLLLIDKARAKDKILLLIDEAKAMKTYI